MLEMPLNNAKKLLINDVYFNNSKLSYHKRLTFNLASLAVFSI